MNTPIIPAALGLLVLCSIQFVESLPINKRMSGSITTPSDVVNMSRSIRSRLIDNQATSEGLLPVFIKAAYLTQSDIFKPEVRCNLRMRKHSRDPSLYNTDSIFGAKSLHGTNIYIQSCKL